MDASSFSLFAWQSNEPADIFNLDTSNKALLYKSYYSL